MRYFDEALSQKHYYVLLLFLHYFISVINFFKKNCSEQRRIELDFKWGFRWKSYNSELYQIQPKRDFHIVQYEPAENYD